MLTVHPVMLTAPLVLCTPTGRKGIRSGMTGKNSALPPRQHFPKINVAVHGQGLAALVRQRREARLVRPLHLHVVIVNAKAAKFQSRLVKNKFSHITLLANMYPANDNQHRHSLN